VLRKPDALPELRRTRGLGQSRCRWLSARSLAAGDLWCSLKTSGTRGKPNSQTLRKVYNLIRKGCGVVMNTNIDGPVGVSTVAVEPARRLGSAANAAAPDCAARNHSQARRLRSAVSTARRDCAALRQPGGTSCWTTSNAIGVTDHTDSLGAQRSPLQADPRRRMHHRTCCAYAWRIWWEFQPMPSSVVRNF
jgi:hypothetical protein